jgi:hypothetical protein
MRALSMAGATKIDDARIGAQSGGGVPSLPVLETIVVLPSDTTILEMVLWKRFAVPGA